MSTITLSKQLAEWRKSERERLLRERDRLTGEVLADRRARMD